MAFWRENLAGEEPIAVVKGNFKGRDPGAHVDRGGRFQFQEGELEQTREENGDIFQGVGVALKVVGLWAFTKNDGD